MRRIITILVPLVLLVFLPDFDAGAYMNAKFEPPDGKVYHGLGQYVPVLYTDAENWQYVADYRDAVGAAPLLYATYQFIEPLAHALDPTQLQDLIELHEYPYLLVVGIAYFDAAMNVDVGAILSGAYDAQIEDVAMDIGALETPVFVRPGFEFGAPGGVHGSGKIGAADFIAIWVKIHTMFDQLGVQNVAWVWNTVNTDQFDYMSYYPGDAYVDWWGINYFTPGQIAGGAGFLADAQSHGKPVMVCESCPIQSNGTANPANWSTWFVPYFNAIASHGHVKGFTYISDPWDRPGFWEEWPTSLIDASETIRAGYAAEMEESRYVHMIEYLCNPGILAGVPSGWILADLGAEGGTDRITVRWLTNTEPGLQGFHVLRATSRNGTYSVVDEGLIPAEGDVSSGASYSFEDLDAVTGVTYFYQVEAVPDAGSSTLCGPVSASLQASQAWAAADASASVVGLDAAGGAPPPGSLLAGLALPCLFLAAWKGWRRARPVNPHRTIRVPRAPPRRPSSG